MELCESLAGSAVSANRAGRPLLAGYLTRKQVAAELRIGIRTFARWRLQRKSPPACRVGGRLLFKRADVLAWIEQQKECAE